MMRRRLTAFALICLALTGCKGTWLMYDTTQKDHLYFTVAGVNNFISFALSASDTLNTYAEVSLVGTPKDYDRDFLIETNDARVGETVRIGSDDVPVLTARPGEDYEYGRWTIPAGEVKTRIPIVLHRTPEIKDCCRKIELVLIESEDFLPMPADSADMKNIITSKFVLYLTDGEPACPEWWKTASNGVDYEWGAYYGVYTPAKYRKMLEFYHSMEDRNPGLYAEFVEKYGVNIDKEGLERNFMSFNDQSVWATYVLIPLHAYYKEYYATHPTDLEIFGPTGDLTTKTWGDPMRLLR